MSRSPATSTDISFAARPENLEWLWYTMPFVGAGIGAFAGLLLQWRGFRLTANG